MKKDIEVKREKLEITFGMIHSYSLNEGIKYVILDVGEGGWFIASQITGDRLGLPGTGSAADIGEIVGNMSFSQIVKGLEATMGSSTDIEAILKEYSQKQSRIITR